MKALAIRPQPPAYRSPVSGSIASNSLPSGA